MLIVQSITVLAAAMSIILSIVNDTPSHCDDNITLFVTLLSTIKIGNHQSSSNYGHTVASHCQTFIVSLR